MDYLSPIISFADTIARIIGWGTLIIVTAVLVNIICTRRYNPK